MGEQNKILDVTYGKFSCRLEGFDDAVETMKTVVAFFHDLAGHDSFMEVAPTMPDLETLARLAEEQSGGTVTVEGNGNGVSMVRSEEAAPESGTQPEDEVAAYDPIAEVIPEEPAALDADMDTAEDESYDDALAMDEADPAETWDETAAIDGAQATAGLETHLEELTEEAVETGEGHDDLQATADITTDEASELDEAEAITEADTADLETVELSAEDEIEDEDMMSVASKLASIRDLVGRGAASAKAAQTAEDDDEPVSAETLPLQLGAQRPMNPLAQRLAELARRNSELMDADTAQPSSDDADYASDMSPVEPDTDETAWSDDQAEMEPEQQSATDAPSDDHVAEEAIEEAGHLAQDSVSDDASALIDENEDKNDPGDDADRPLLLTTPQRPQSGLIKQLQEEDDAFDLSAELAQIEAEIAARPSNEMSRHGLPRRVEDAMSRILNETNQHLEEPESRRHRDALAQLRAAVAATEAAERLGDANRSRDAGDAYREDLGALDAAEAPRSAAVPPLKLVKTVAEEVPQPAQRVTSKPLDVAAQRLREIAATKENDTQDGGSVDFAAFLAEHSVTELADKLEAAAAYLAFVEGKADFTRPQLMRLVQSTAREEIAREDGLRCFGRLLRQSRFVKLDNGRFQVSENSPFRPRNSRAAQG